MLITAYPPIENIWFYLFVVGALISLATYTWQFRKIPGAKPQAYGQMCKCAWLLFMVLASVSPELPVKMFWFKLHLMAVALSPYFWFAFVLGISNQEKSIPPMVKYIFLGIIGCLWLVLLSDSWHGLFVKQAWLDGQTLKVVLGFANLALGVNSYILCAMAMSLSIRWIFITVGLRRRQALWFTISGLFSLMSSLLENISGVEWMSPLPLGFLLAALFITWGFYRWQVYNVFSLAQKVAVQNMFDGLLVVDEYGYIADMNPAAKTIFTGLPASVGDKFEELAAAWPALAELDDRPGLQAIDAVREFPGGSHYYQLNVTSLQIKGHSLGKVIVIKDITEQKLNQAKLMEQQKVLSILTERNRLSREIHDAHGQFPGYVKIQTQAIGLLLQKGRLVDVTQQLDLLTKAADVAFTDVRESITGLKQDDGEWDFLKNLQKWLSQFQKNSSINTVYTGPRFMPPSCILPEAEVQLLRIIQEVLTNVRKHSGANRVEVAFHFTDAQLMVTITDNGCGFDEEKTSNDLVKFGLVILRERAVEIGGTCMIRSIPAQGTVVSVGIPLFKIA